MMRPGEEKVPSRNPSWVSVLVYCGLVVILLWFWHQVSVTLPYRTIPYSEFKAHVERGEVAECTIAETEIRGKLVAANVAAAGEAAAGAEGQPLLFRTTRVEDPDLVAQLTRAKVQFVGEQPSMLLPVLGWIVPVILLALLWFFLLGRTGTPGQSVMSFGKSRARLVADREVGVDFEDVAGCDEAKLELREVVDFLRDPNRFTALGAKIPKGVLLVGPPGTGKTLLARAVAGEAKVPFYSLSGSEFVEMFVGVGAARVRDLFEQAKTHAPCIIFIDELDAIGRQRGVHLSNVNDEREHTLNQMLVEMDGFEANVGVILLAATNRPDVLDPALLRPGRFDRQVIIDAPDMNGRESILRVHARNKRLAPDVDLARIALTTPGFSGADLANAMNEAALLAVRRKAVAITQEHIEEAVEKVVAGPERKSHRLRDEEKRRVAYHETGHALVAAFSRYADPVRKISIVPRGRAALGYTLQLPTGEQHLMSRSELLDRLKGLLGGRAAEEHVFHEVSTGAENDLERATTLARQFVCQFGMGESVGLMHCARQVGPVYGSLSDQMQRDCSEQTARDIDEEVKNLLTGAYQEALAILETHDEDLERVTAELLRRETLDEATFKQLLEAGRKSVSEKSLGRVA